MKSISIMYRIYTKLIIIRTVIFLVQFFSISSLMTNTTIPFRRSTDSISNANELLNRQYPDASFLLPHLIVGVFIPIAVIIGIGVVLMKLFIIGFWLLGRGGYNLAPNLGPYYPWRVEQQQIQRSLRSKDGSGIQNYLSATIWHLLERLSNSLEKYQNI